MLSLFGTEMAISYNTVDRLYSDPLVIMILNYIFVSTLKKKGIGKCVVTGDGISYSYDEALQINQ